MNSMDPRTQFTHGAGRSAICFADFGPADGYPVLFLHQSPGCRLSMRWFDFVASLGGRLHLVRPTGVWPVAENSRSVRGRLCAGRRRGGRCACAHRVCGRRYSGGAPHALAVGAKLGDRVSRVACYGPIAPSEKLGLAEWTKDQGEDMHAFVAALQAGEATLTPLLGSEDAAMRSSASADEPAGAAILEATRDGVGGWVDDELACFRPWGFDVREVVRPTWIWSNPNDTVTPPNHAAWLAAAIPTRSSFRRKTPSATWPLRIPMQRGPSSTPG